MRPARQEREARELAELRQEAGLWLRDLRERRGLSQRQLAERVGLEYYTFVSQIEAGRGRLPSERYQQWADALQIDAATFVRTMLRFYEPSTYQILFNEPPVARAHQADMASAVVIPLRLT